MATSSASIDTSAEVNRLVAEIWASKTPQERIEAVLALCEDVDRVARAGILEQQPDLTEPQIIRELARRRYGDDLVNEAWGSDLSQ
jgi:hypothetical protein